MQKIYKSFFDKEDKVDKVKIPKGATILSITIGAREVIIYTLAEDKVEFYNTMEVKVINPEKDIIDTDLTGYTFFNPLSTYENYSGKAPYFVWYKIIDNE
jgi:hypothetical protein